METMAAQREAERALAIKAVGELKKFHSKVRRRDSLAGRIATTQPSCNPPYNTMTRLSGRGMGAQVQERDNLIKQAKLRQVGAPRHHRRGVIDPAAADRCGLRSRRWTCRRA
jgi:hypothetical protein